MKILFLMLGFVLSLSSWSWGLAAPTLFSNASQTLLPDVGLYLQTCVDHRDAILKPRGDVDKYDASTIVHALIEAVSQTAYADRYLKTLQQLIEELYRQEAVLARAVIEDIWAKYPNMDQDVLVVMLGAIPETDWHDDAWLDLLGREFDIAFAIDKRVLCYELFTLWQEAPLMDEGMFKSRPEVYATTLAKKIRFQIKRLLTQSPSEADLSNAESDYNRKWFRLQDNVESYMKFAWDDQAAYALLQEVNTYVDGHPATNKVLLQSIVAVQLRLFEALKQAANVSEELQEIVEGFNNQNSLWRFLGRAVQQRITKAYADALVRKGKHAEAIKVLRAVSDPMTLVDMAVGHLLFFEALTNSKLWPAWDNHYCEASRRHGLFGRKFLEKRVLVYSPPEAKQPVKSLRTNANFAQWQQQAIKDYRAGSAQVAMDVSTRKKASKKSRTVEDVFLSRQGITTRFWQREASDVNPSLDSEIATLNNALKEGASLSQNQLFSARIVRAILYFLKKDYKNAQDDAEWLIERYQDMGFLIMAEVFAAQNQPAEAVRFYAAFDRVHEETVDKSAAMQRALLQRTILFAELNQHAESQRLLGEVLENLALYNDHDLSVLRGLCRTFNDKAAETKVLSQWVVFGGHAHAQQPTQWLQTTFGHESVGVVLTIAPTLFSLNQRALLLALYRFVEKEAPTAMRDFDHFYRMVRCQHLYKDYGQSVQSIDRYLQNPDGVTQEQQATLRVWRFVAQRLQKNAANVVPENLDQLLSDVRRYRSSLYNSSFSVMVEVEVLALLGLADEAWRMFSEYTQDKSRHLELEKQEPQLFYNAMTRVMLSSLAMNDYRESYLAWLKSQWMSVNDNVKAYLIREALIMVVAGVKKHDLGGLDSVLDTHIDPLLKISPDIDVRGLWGGVADSQHMQGYSFLDRSVWLNVYRYATTKALQCDQARGRNLLAARVSQNYWKMQLVVIYEQLGDYQEAIRLYQEVSSTTSASDWDVFFKSNDTMLLKGLFHAALAYQGLNNSPGFMATVKDWEKLLSSRDHQVLYRFFQEGYVNEGLFSFDEAKLLPVRVQGFRLLISQNPDQPSYRLTLIDLLTRLGLSDDAQVEMKPAWSMSLQNSLWTDEERFLLAYRYSLLLADAGAFNEAEKVLKQALPKKDEAQWLEQHPDFVLKYIDMLFRLRHYAGVQAQTQSMVDLGISLSIKLSYARALSLIATSSQDDTDASKKRWQEVQDLLQKVFKDQDALKDIQNNSTDTAMLLLLKAYLAHQKGQEAECARDLEEWQKKIKSQNIVRDLLPAFKLLQVMNKWELLNSLMDQHREAISKNPDLRQLRVAVTCHQDFSTYRNDEHKRQAIEDCRLLFSQKNDGYASVCLEYLFDLHLWSDYRDVYNSLKTKSVPFSFRETYRYYRASLEVMVKDQGKGVKKKLESLLGKYQELKQSDAWSKDCVDELGPQIEWAIHRITPSSEKALIDLATRLIGLLEKNVSLSVVVDKDIYWARAQALAKKEQWTLAIADVNHILTLNLDDQEKKSYQEALRKWNEYESVTSLNDSKDEEEEEDDSSIEVDSASSSAVQQSVHPNPEGYRDEVASKELSKSIQGFAKLYFAYLDNPLIEDADGADVLWAAFVNLRQKFQGLGAQQRLDNESNQTLQRYVLEYGHWLHTVQDLYKREKELYEFVLNVDPNSHAAMFRLGILHFNDGEIARGDQAWTGLKDYYVVTEASVWSEIDTKRFNAMVKAYLDYAAVFLLDQNPSTKAAQTMMNEVFFMVADGRIDKLDEDLQAQYQALQRDA